MLRRMWKRILSHPWAALAGWGVVIVQAVVGWPGTVDDWSKWPSVELNILTFVSWLLAVALVAAHVTWVGAHGGEPYRGWIRRAGLHSWLRARATTVRVVCLTADTANKHIKRRTLRLPVREQSLIEFPVVEGSPKYCIEVPRGFRLEFADDDRYYVPRNYARWPEETNRYVLGDKEPPRFARCKVAVYWIGREEEG